MDPSILGHLLTRHKFMNLFPKGEWHIFLYKLSYLIYYLTQLQILKRQVRWSGIPIS